MKKPRKTPVRSESSIVDGVLYFEDARQCDVDSDAMKEIIGDGYTNAIRVVSLDTNWYQTIWLGYDVKIKEDINVQMTLRRETRSGRGHWYAYRRVARKLYKRYVGTDDNINQKRLLEIAQKMPSL